MIMDFSNVCRLCTGIFQQNAMFPLFNGNDDLPAKIELLARVQICVGDGLPNHACEKCVDTLNSFIEFRTLVENSDVNLRGYLRSQDDVECIEIFVKEEDTTNEGNFILSTTIADDGNDEDDDDIQEMEDPLLIKEVQDIALQNVTVSNNCEVESERDSRIDEKPAVPVLTFDCDFCTRKFSMFQGFMSHMKKHPRIECTICNKIFSTWQTFRIHRQTHTDNSGLKCPNCSKRFNNEKELKVHCARHHINERSLECKVCKKSFNTQRSLMLHSVSHSEDRRHICTTCNEEFKTGFGLRSHSYLHTINSSNRSDPEPNSYECEFCKRKFALFRSLRCHQRYCRNFQSLSTSVPASNQQESSVMPRRIYECPVCGKRFEEWLSLHYHVRFHKRISRKCTVCLKHFKSLKGLRAHEKTHKSLIAEEIAIDHETFAEDRSINSPELDNEINEDPSSRINNLSSLENECKICKEHFESDEALRIHSTKIHQQLSIPLSDLTDSSGVQDRENSLPKQKTVNKQLSESLSNHDQQFLVDDVPNKKTGQVMCAECKRYFKNVTGLKCHIGKMHKHIEQESYSSPLELENSPIENDLQSNPADVENGVSSLPQNVSNQNIFENQLPESLSNQKDQLPVVGVPNKNSGQVMCTECQRCFKNANGLKCHIGKMHKHIEQESYSSPLELENSPIENDLQSNPADVENGVSSLPQNVSNQNIFENQLPESLSNQKDQLPLVGVPNKKSGQVMCTECQRCFKNANGLKSHIGKMHKHLQHESYSPSRDLENSPIENDLQSNSPDIQNGSSSLPENVSNQKSDNSQLPESLSKREIHQLFTGIRNKKRGKIMCIECKQHFRNRIGLKYHVVKMHKSYGVSSELGSGSIVHECNKCKLHFKNVRGLKDHNTKRHSLDRVSNHNESERMHQNKLENKCKICHQGFVSVVDLNFHYRRMHTEFQDNVDETFSVLHNISSETESKSHLSEMRHSQMNQIKCPECHRYFKNKKALAAHTGHRHRHETFTVLHNISSETESESHSSEMRHSQMRNQIKCPECHRYFKNKKALAAHIGHRHPRNKIYQNHRKIECPVCKLCFMNERALDTHVKIHSQSSVITSVTHSELINFPGEIENGREFPGMVQYQNPSQVECSECHLWFKNARALRTHTFKKHVQSSTAYSVTHSEMHSGLAEIQSKTQSSENATYQNAGEFECSECRLCFKNARALRTHTFKKHVQPSTTASATHSDTYSGFAEIQNEVQLPENDTYQDAGEFQCSDCRLCFKNARALRTHTFKKHIQSSVTTSATHSDMYSGFAKIQNTKQFECSECRLCFKDNRALKIHTTKKHVQLSSTASATNYDVYSGFAEIQNDVQLPKNAEQFECSECRLCFKNARALRTHTFKKHIQSSSTASASHSDMYSGFAEIQNEVQLPENASYQNAEQFECSDCRLCFKNARALRTHTFKKHVQSSSTASATNSGFAEIQNEIQLPENDSYQNALFECSECRLYFKNARALRTHTYKKHIQSSVIASATHSDTYTDFAEIQNEIQSPENSSYQNAGRFECSECKLYFKNKRALSTHRFKRHTKSEYMLHSRGRQIECPECKLCFKNVRAIRSHISKMHRLPGIANMISYPEVKNNSYGIQCDDNLSESQANDRIQCPLCDLNFKNARTLEIHTSRMHRQSSNLISSTEMLNDSLEVQNMNCSQESMHEEILENKCSKCNLRFKNVRGLKRHVKRIHKKLQNTTKLLVTSTEIHNSRRSWQDNSKTFSTHNKEEIVMTPANNVNFMQQNILQTNSYTGNEINTVPAPRRDLHVNGYYCVECNKIFENERGLKVHNEMRHRGRSDNKEEDESFTNSGILIHNAEIQKQLNSTASSSQISAKNCLQEQKVYECKVCNHKTESLRKFRFHMTVKEHMIPENIEQQPDDDHLDALHCPICNKLYFSLQRLEEHKVKVHKMKSFKQIHSASSMNISNKNSEYGLIALTKKSFCCSQCSKNFNTLPELTHHYRSQHNIVETVDKSPQPIPYESDSVFKCCDKLFSSMKALKVHQYHHHRSNDLDSTEDNSKQIASYVCTVCNKSFNSKHGLKIHQAKIHIEEDINDVESVSSRSSTKPCNKDGESEKNESLNVITNSLPEYAPINDEEKLSVCNKSFDNDHQLDVQCADIENHVGTSEYRTSLLNSHFCSTCNKTFSSERDLNIHMAETHLEIVSGSSDRSVQSESLSDDSSSVSIDEQITTDTYNCSICNKSCNSEDDLKLHQAKVHLRNSDKMMGNNNSDYFAEPSGEVKSVNHEQMFQQGKQDEGEKSSVIENDLLHSSYVCNICNLRFLNETDLDIHSSECHSEKQLIDYRNMNVNIIDSVGTSEYRTSVANSFHCSVCNKPFPSEHSLNLHAAEAHLENVSESSDRSFLSQIMSDSSSPLEIVEQTSGYFCSACNKSYSNELELKIHQAQMHLKENDKMVGNNFSEDRAYATVSCGEGTSVNHKRKSHQEMEGKESDKRVKRSLNDDNASQSSCVCTICNVRFHNERYLKIHSSECHREKQDFINYRNVYVPNESVPSVQSSETFVITCSYCDRKFTSEDALVLHHSKTHMTSDI